MSLLVTKLMIDVVMAVLLIGTIWYCKRLDTRIKILQDSKSELAKMVKQFDDSTEKATLCIGEIHKVSQRVHENMRHHMDKANYIANDLSFMIDRGRKVAGMSETELDDAADTIARNSKRAGLTGKSETVKKEDAAKSASRSKTSGPVKGGRRSEDLAIEDKSIKDDNQKIEKMLSALSQAGSDDADTRIVEPTEVMTPEEVSQEKPSNVKLRSKAEQELYEALRSSGGSRTVEES